MPLFHPGAARRKDADPKIGQYRSARRRWSACRCANKFFARVLIKAVGEFALLFVPTAVFCQDNGSSEKEFFGNGVAISVTVHDDSGTPIPSPAMVKVFRDGIPSRQAQTSRGNTLMVGNSVGEFTVIVDAPGFREGREDLSVHGAGNAQVDVYLKRLAKDDAAAGVPGRAILAPKAKEALDKGLQALSTNKQG